MQWITFLTLLGKKFTQNLLIGEMFWKRFINFTAIWRKSLKENDFLEGLGQGDIEIEDNVNPEDVSEEDAPIIKFVHSVIKDALERRASDIHMEPLEKISRPISD